MDKVYVIKGSLRCYALGWFALIPLLGIGPAAVAILIYKRVQRETGEEWNPARRQLYCGWILSWLGLLFSTVVGGLALAAVVRGMM